MRARKIDSNHGSIVSALRQVGCTVQSLAAVGKGCPDLLVGINGRNYLFEVKNDDMPPSKQKLTPDEAIWNNEWKGQITVVTTADEAIARLNRRPIFKL